MANLSELDSWEAGIYQIETLDDVEGGPDGVANRQARELANRTVWLKAQIASLVDAGYLSPKDITTMLASQAEAEAGTSDSKLMTPHRVAQAIAALATIVAATETIAGKTRFATATETLAGTLNNIAVHPAGVHAVFNQLLTQITGSAPAVLDTFYEFAAALGNNPNYAADMATALATKLTQTQGDARYLLASALAALIQGQTYTAFSTGGATGAFTLTPTPAPTALAANQRFTVKFHAVGNGSDTLAVSGLGAVALKQYDSAGNKVAPVIVAGQQADVLNDGVNWVILDPLPPAASRQILPCGASVSANALTVSISPQNIDFRSPTLTDGSVNQRAIVNALSLTVPAGAQLGTASGAAEQLAILALDNAGTIEPAVCNIKALAGIDESSLITTRAIGAVAISSTLNIFGDGSCRALYRFEGNANDVSGAYNGTASAISYSAGAFGQYMQTSGAAGSRVTVPWSLLSGTASRAISFRFYIDQSQPTISLFGSHYDGSVRGFVLIYTGGGTASSIADGGTVVQHAFHLYNGGASNTDNYWNISFAEQVGWHNGVISVDTTTGTANLWVDKVLIGTITSTALMSFNPSYTGTIPLGEEPYGGIHAVCKMDQVRFFTRALAQADVNTLYAEDGADPTIIYSTTARNSLPWRLVGKVNMTQPVAGQWSAAPTLVQGAGGQATPGRSIVRVGAHNGYGTTYTAIPRFTYVWDYKGKDITYADSAAQGGSFTINTPGIYAITHAWSSSANSNSGITLNTSAPTSYIYNTPGAEILATATSFNNNSGCTASWQGFLPAGSVIRGHRDGVSAYGNGNSGVSFTITGPM